MNIKQLTALGALIVAGSLAPQLAHADDYVDCESENGRYHHCRAETRNGVTLVAQYSKAGCYMNDTWGYDSRGVWVTNGCRAQFHTGKSGRDKHNSTASKVAAVALIGALAAAAASENKHDNEDRRYREYANEEWRSSGHTEYENAYRHGCDAARMGRDYLSYQSQGWRNGYLDCRHR